MFFSWCVWVHAQLLQSCLTLWGSMDQSFSIHWILQARILEWIAMPSSKGSSWPRDWSNVSCISCIANRFFTDEPPGKPFTYDETGVTYFSKKVQRGKVSFSSCQYWWCILSTWLITADVDLDHLGEVCQSGFSTVKLHVFLPFHSVFFGIKLLHRAHSSEVESNILLPWG